MARLNRLSNLSAGILVASKQISKSRGKVSATIIFGLLEPSTNGCVYGCPLISWTEPNKTSVEGIIILHDWWKKEDCKDPASKPLEGSSYTMEDALIYIDQVIAGF